MSKIHEFNNPIPVYTPLGPAYAIYVTANGMFENDEFTCAMLADGQIRHFNSDQIKMWHNKTYGIEKNENPV